LLEPVVERALARDPAARHATAREMEEALLAAVPRLPSSEVGAWARELGRDFLVGRNALLAHEEVSWRRRHGNLESGTRIIVGPREASVVPGVASPITAESVVTIASERQGPVPERMPAAPPGRRLPPWFWAGLLSLACLGVGTVLVVDHLLSPVPPVPEAAAAAAPQDDPSASTATERAPPPSAEPARVVVPRVTLPRLRSVAAPRRSADPSASPSASAAPGETDALRGTR
jgi:hypothetical protein